MYMRFMHRRCAPSRTWSSSVTTIATTFTICGVSSSKAARWANRASIASIPFGFRRSCAI
jgi:hypothetical protein